jgi:hypothetical protein
MKIDLGDYMTFLGFIITHVNGDAKTYVYDTSELTLKIVYMKNETSCLIMYNRTTKLSYSFHKGTYSSENKIFELLEDDFENNLNRYKLYLSRKLKIEKLLNNDIG